MEGGKEGEKEGGRKTHGRRAQREGGREGDSCEGGREGRDNRKGDGLMGGRGE